MDLTGEDLARISSEIVRVSRTEFFALWSAAEAYHDRPSAEKVMPWEAFGVALTCRWLARAASRRRGAVPEMTESPITEQARLPSPELIEAEYLAALRILARRPRHPLVEDRPGWVEAIAATLDWTFRGSGRPPQFGERRLAS